jgi:hypothetical protein
MANAINHEKFMFTLALDLELFKAELWGRGSPLPRHGPGLVAKNRAATKFIKVIAIIVER